MGSILSFLFTIIIILFMVLIIMFLGACVILAPKYLAKEIRKFDE